MKKILTVLLLLTASIAIAQNRVEYKRLLPSQMSGPCVPPATITGSLNVCVGNTTALSDVTVGGTWRSSMTPVATINSSGVMTGVSAGTTTISYTMPTGCYTSKITTVTLCVSYATWNPADKTSNIVLSNGNLTMATNSNASSAGVRATVGVGAGWWYWEENIVSEVDGGMITGFSSSTQPIGSLAQTGTGYGAGYFAQYQTIQVNNNFGAYSCNRGYTGGDVLCFLVNGTAHQAYVLVNGVEALNSPPMTGLPTTVYPSDGCLGSFSAGVHTANFGADLTNHPFSYYSAAATLCSCTPNMGVYQ